MRATYTHCGRPCTAAHTDCRDYTHWNVIQAYLEEKEYKALLPTDPVCALAVLLRVGGVAKVVGGRIGEFYCYGFCTVGHNPPEGLCWLTRFLVYRMEWTGGLAT